MKNADDFSRNKVGSSGRSKEERTEFRQDVVDAYTRNAGNISAAAREVGITRMAVRFHVTKAGLHKKPMAGGQLVERIETKESLPPKGIIKRYICTSAQNNTRVNQKFWDSLLVLADYYDADIFVGTFSYNQNNFGNLAVKQGTRKPAERKLWFDPAIEDYINDERVELAPGLIWCGEMNILPTAVDPLSGLETYTHRRSAIIPHAKIAMRSIATMQGEGTKFNYTTGTVTQRNYIQKKEGLKAEHHHRYAALVIEVNDKGNWWVRQIGVGSKMEVLQDLDIAVIDGKIVKKQTVEALNWGDLHATMAEPWVVEASQNMLDTLRPKYQFIHDVLEGASINRHQIKDKNPHYGFHRWLRGLHKVEEELAKSVELVHRYCRDWCSTIVPDSNHDGWWLKSWLAKYDYRVDPANAELFLDMQSWFYKQLRGGLIPKEVNLTAYTLKKFGVEGVKFLIADESFTICNRKIECGMHGHLGPDGARGTPRNLNLVGRRANTGHTHSAGIWNGLYVAGTSTKLTAWDYTYGPSSWSHSHIVTYPNGQRAIITMYNGKWRA